MTATEILKNLELINRELGPTLGNIEDGGLKPHAERTYALMYRAGAFSRRLMCCAARRWTEFEGPLARAQRSGDVTALQTALALVAAIAEHDPEAMDLPDTDEIVKYTWEVTGNPMRLLRATSVIAAKRQARADAEVQQQQAALGNSQMDMMKKGADTKDDEDTFAPTQRPRRPRMTPEEEWAHIKISSAPWDRPRAARCWRVEVDLRDDVSSDESEDSRF
jgi:hypothetical protein